MNKINKIYYINLDFRKDRKQNFLSECNKANISLDKIERFEAINGNTYSFSKRELNLFKNADYNNYSYATKIYGNQLSHYYILKEMVEKSYDYIIVCQDDVIFCDNFNFHLNNVMNSLPNNSEIINIGFHKYACFSKFIPWDLNVTNNNVNELGKFITDGICELNHTINPCSLAYIVTLTGAKNIIRYFETVGFLRATDWNFNDYLIKKGIFYGSNKVLCTGDPQFGSDIFN